MVSKEYSRIGERTYHTELPNGLHIYVDRRPEFQKSYAFSAINYGGMDTKFRLDGQWRGTLVGVAHFLKHKMFDTEDGNVLRDLAANGVPPNAFASSALAGYYFESMEKLCDNPKIPLPFTPIPWFIQESMGKEQGITGQEIYMVEDGPDNQAFYGLMECLFDHHSIRMPIAGTQESISHITADILYACHKALYTPFNMVLTVAGDVEPEEVVRTARKILPKEPGGHIERDYSGEKDGAAAKPEKELRMEMPTPILQLGFEAEPALAGEEHPRRQLIGGLACGALLDNSSPPYARLYSEGFISKNSGYGFGLYPGCPLMTTGGESRDPQAVRDAVLAEEARITREGVGEGLFRQLEKGVYGAKVWGLNSFENVCIELARTHFADVEYLTSLEVFDGTSRADVEDCIRRWVTPERRGLTVVRPGEEV